ncbi:MAG: alpha/beta hydrolase [Pseudomonadota bacterium]
MLTWRRIVFAIIAATSLVWSTGRADAPDLASECVVFLHGLARTSRSMEKIETAFAEQGYRTANVDYPSRIHRIEVLAPHAVQQGLETCRAGEASRIHFITHSLGGILVRYYLDGNRIEELGRVVMLAPPNQGSEVVDDYRDTPGYEQLNGPAGAQLGTDANSIPLNLGPVDFPLGVVAGTSTINPILSQSLPNPDDGKVSVANTRVDGMADFLVVDVSHPFIMRSDTVIEQAQHFIAVGTFKHSAEALDAEH